MLSAKMSRSVLVLAVVAALTSLGAAAQSAESHHRPDTGGDVPKTFAVRNKSFTYKIEAYYFSEEAAAIPLEGTVTVLIVNKDGGAAELTVLKSVGVVLDARAINMAKNYMNLARNGGTLHSQDTVEITFRFADTAAHAHECDVAAHSSAATDFQTAQTHITAVAPNRL